MCGKLDLAKADATTTSNTKPLCSDSDGGYNVFIRGTCTDSVGGVITSRNLDTCTNGSLREFYCSSNISRCINAFGSCPSGYICENGACISSDTTPPIIDVFNVSFGYIGNSSRIYLYAQAHDYESEMAFVFHGFAGPSGGFGGARPCQEGHYCSIDSIFPSPEPGLWNVTVSFTNNINLTITQTQPIYVPGRSFFGRIRDLFKRIF